MWIILEGISTQPFICHILVAELLITTCCGSFSNQIAQQLKTVMNSFFPEGITSVVVNRQADLQLHTSTRTCYRTHGSS
jgi:hypothetical protein